jgi:hypothetical protein
MPPILPDRILAVVTARPGISVTQIVAMLKDASPLGLLAALNELRLSRKIESRAGGYRLVRPKSPPPILASTLAPPSREGLMAGR